MNPEPDKAAREQCRQPRPDWVPPECGDSFATWILQGVSPGGASTSDDLGERRRILGLNDYLSGVRASDAAILARAITLVESNAAHHQHLAQQLVNLVLPETGKAMRVGITGIPGVGKSTFIESLGLMLCEQGHRVAVLAVDPSSARTGGSILGDKVRMERLGRDARAYIRPSPTGGSLGGVARKSREAMLLCEAAGYDVILVETVGVGQSEVTVRSMVDCFLVLMMPGTGDEVQGIKKGVVELADLLVVNKADGDNLPKAQRSRAELLGVLPYLQPATEGWATPVLLAAGQTGQGVAEVWAKLQAFFETGKASGSLEERREQQAVQWLHALIKESLSAEFYRKPAVLSQLMAVELAVVEGKISAYAGARKLLGL